MVLLYLMFNPIFTIWNTAPLIVGDGSMNYTLLTGGLFKLITIVVLVCLYLHILYKYALLTRVETHRSWCHAE